MHLVYTPPRLLAPPESRSGDRYLLGFGLVLLGYTLMSRGFAYLGVPPLYIGEIMLLLGGLQVLRVGADTTLKALTIPCMALLGLFFLHALARTVPFLGTYRLDAVRDFMQVGYAVFALFMVVLLIERPRRIVDLVVRYRTFAAIVVALVWLPFTIYKFARPDFLMIPWAPNTQFIEAKAGDIMVHLAGITVFLMVGLMRARPLLVFALAATAGFVMVSNRGGMVAFFLACATAFLLRPPGARPGKLAYAFVLLLVAGFLIGPIVTLPTQGRDISVEQLWLNIVSIFGDSGADNLEGTVSWRQDWWTKIYNYTVHGPYFWGGRGFGVNLAVGDGFHVVTGLRSPHNGHMTILARMGVPGTVLWLLLQVVWMVTLLGAWWRARVTGHHRWMALFVVFIAYFIAAHVNAAFDVYFEGPMGGIWFWAVFGAALGSVWIFRRDPGVLDLLDSEEAPPEPPAGGDGWAGENGPGTRWSWRSQPQGVSADGPWHAPAPHLSN